MKEEEVILVDENDKPIGKMAKMEAHEKGLLHRAFSVFIMNKEGKLLLQQRAFSKYHSPRLWTNACCSHQRLGESSIAAGERRLKEELGLEVSLEFLFSFIYKVSFDNGLTEHELDHVLVGFSEAEPKINPHEVADWKWESLDNVTEDIASSPENYTFWFNVIFRHFRKHIQTVKQ